MTQREFAVKFTWDEYKEFCKKRGIDRYDVDSLFLFSFRKQVEDYCFRVYSLKTGEGK